MKKTNESSIDTIACVAGFTIGSGENYELLGKTLSIYLKAQSCWILCNYDIK